MNDMKPIVVIGGGGHASVLVDLILLRGFKIKGFVAPERSVIKGFSDIAYLGDDASLLNFSPDEIYLVYGIGAVSPEGNQRRSELFTFFKQKGYEFLTIIHPSAVVSKSVTIGEGVQIMAGCVVQANTIIEANTIINTRASIDHDCVIGHSVHIAPGAVLSGGVRIRDQVMVGVGATLIQGVTVEKQMLVRAGKVVIKNIEACQKV